MGATTDHYTYDCNDRAKIEREFEAACGQARYEDGNEYPGTIACFESISTWRDRQFDSEQKAINYLVDHHEKWTNAMAVSFHLPAEPTKADIQKRENAKQALASWERRYYDARQKINETFMARKGGSVGCPTCKSRLSRGRLSRPNCPLCDANLLGATDQKRLSNLKARVGKARRELEKVSRPAPSEAIGWVVGGWCPE